MGLLGKLTDQIEHAIGDELKPAWRKIRQLRDEAKIALALELLKELPTQALTEMQTTLPPLIAAELARRAAQEQQQ